MAGVLALGATAGAACGRAPLAPLDPSAATEMMPKTQTATGAGGGPGGSAGPRAIGAPGSGAPGAGGSAASAPGASAPADTAASPRYVFISSTAYPGGELGGLDGADAKCQGLAEAAGLPGSYRAWLSDPTGSPATRFVRGGGPFRLVDGSLVAESWAELTSRPLHHAIDLTETGQTPPMTSACGWSPAVAVVWSDTRTDGTLLSADLACGSWNDETTGRPACGLVPSQLQWSDVGNGGFCSSLGAIYCFEQEGPALGDDGADANGPSAGAPSGCDTGACATGPKTVFVTSETYTGDLGGLAGADSKCQARAKAAGLSGVYLAWLSDYSDWPAKRFSRAGSPYRLVDGSVVANDWSSLTSGTLRHAIDRTELGGAPATTDTPCGGASVWTNTRADGSLDNEANSCGDWTDSIGGGAALGLVNAQASGWTADCWGGVCGGHASLYCFEQ
jgi:hypothetical protein